MSTLQSALPALFSRTLPRRYAVAAVLCGLTALLAWPLNKWLDIADSIMLFLLTVFVVAVRLGRGPAVLSTFVSVVLFDWVLVPPYLSFSAVDPRHLVTLFVMLAVSLIASHLAARLAERTAEAQARERETRLLYELARNLGGALDVEQVMDTLERFLGPLGMTAGLLVDIGAGGARSLSAFGLLARGTSDEGPARAAYEENAVRSESNRLYLPFSGATRTRGVLVVAPAVTSMRPLLDATASLTGIAIERLHYADIVQRHELDMQAEKLRSTILSSLSHDLRTPLTSLVGQAEALAERQGEMPPAVAGRASIVLDQARALHRMVTNLLDMARLQSGGVVLHKQWQPFEDVIGSSLRLLDDLLAPHPLAIDCPADLPLVCFDAVLLERVLCNLLENAAKHSPAGAAIGIEVRRDVDDLVVVVRNAGGAFPPDKLEQVFEMFTRGSAEPATPGAGIGLAVCRAIVIAHDGHIAAVNSPDAACVRFTLPLGSPPTLESELP